MLIKNIFLVLLFIFFASTSTAQPAYYLSVIADENNLEDISDLSYSHLETKLLQILTQNNVAATGLGHPIVIYPKVEIRDEMIQEGVEDVYYLFIDVNFIVKNINADIVYSTFTASLKGYDTSKDKAINKAIKSLPTNTEEIDKFLQQTQKKVFNYFNQNCSTILKLAQTFADKQEFNRAFEELERIPTASQCYFDALEQCRSIFIKSQKPICGTALRKAKTFVAQDKYQEAMVIIASIKYGTPCDKEINDLLVSIRKEIDDRELRGEKYQLDMQKYQLQLEQLRNRGVSSVPPSIPQMREEYNSSPITSQSDF